VVARDIERAIALRSKHSSRSTAGKENIDLGPIILQLFGQKLGKLANLFIEVPWRQDAAVSIDLGQW